MSHTSDNATGTPNPASAQLDYVAIGPNAYGFGDSRKEAVKNCARSIPWIYIKADVKTVTVESYAYLPSQELTVSKIDGAICWENADHFDVVASREEGTIRRPRNR